MRSRGSSTTHSSRRVPPRVAADAALVVLAHVEAALAEADAFLDRDDRAGQPLGVGALDGEQVEREPLRALRTDAGQPAELLDEVLDRAPRTPTPPPRPARRQAEPAGELAHGLSSSSLAARSASLTAAVTMSWSISTSSGSTTSGLISMPTSAVAGRPCGDHPPPAEPGDLSLAELLLRLRHLPLQRLGLAQHLVHVRHDERPFRGWSARQRTGRRCRPDRPRGPSLAEVAGERLHGEVVHLGVVGELSRRLLAPPSRGRPRPPGARRRRRGPPPTTTLAVVAVADGAADPQAGAEDAREHLAEGPRHSSLAHCSAWKRDWGPKPRSSTSPWTPTGRAGVRKAWRRRLRSFTASTTAGQLRWTSSMSTAAGSGDAGAEDGSGAAASGAGAPGAAGASSAAVRVPVVSAPGPSAPAPSAPAPSAPPPSARGSEAPGASERPGTAVRSAAGVRAAGQPSSDTGGVGAPSLPEAAADGAAAGGPPGAAGDGAGGASDGADAAGAAGAAGGDDDEAADGEAAHPRPALEPVHPRGERGRVARRPRAAPP
jgi:hypothetical protein